MLQESNGNLGLLISREHTARSCILDHGITPSVFRVVCIKQVSKDVRI